MDLFEQARLRTWVEKNWRHGPCPVCQANEWSPNARLGQISNLEYAGNMVPVLLICCNNCGYTISINALVAGIWEPPTAPEGAEPWAHFPVGPSPDNEQA